MTIRMWKLIALTLTLVLGGGLAMIGQAQTHPRPSTPSQPAAQSGRFQIVNGTPDLSRNIMLLDTWTGTSWIICDGPQGTNWCSMDKDYRQVVSNVPQGASDLSQPSAAPAPAPYDSNGVCTGTVTPTGCVQKQQH